MNIQSKATVTIYNNRNGVSVGFRFPDNVLAALGIDPKDPDRPRLKLSGTAANGLQMHAGASGLLYCAGGPGLKYGWQIARNHGFGNVAGNAEVPITVTDLNGHKSLVFGEIPRHLRKKEKDYGRAPKALRRPPKTRKAPTPAHAVEALIAAVRQFNAAIAAVENADITAVVQLSENRIGLQLFVGEE